MNEEYVATTLFGLEEVLEKEIKESGIEETQRYQRAVKFRASRAQMYRLNLGLRTAIRILLNVKTFHIKNADHLYKEIHKIDWPDYFSYKKSIAVRSAVSSNIFTHSHFVSLKVKDAIVDRFRKEGGIRPSVDTRNPDISINVHVNGTRVDVSLDSSGDPLFKRGYRTNQYTAPLNEVLAAGMILMTGWHGESEFIDPMCGSGTLPIEAALIAKNVPPGIFRNSYAFMNWHDYDEELFHRMIDKILVEKEFKHKIIGSDHSEEAVALAKANVRQARLDDIVEIKKMDFTRVRPGSDSGILMMNPPYGERLQEDEIIDLYSKIGDLLKNNFPGYSAWILSANMEAMKFIGLRPSAKKDLLNGKLKCKFNKYDLFKGKRKDQFNNS